MEFDLNNAEEQQMEEERENTLEEENIDQTVSCSGQIPRHEFYQSGLCPSPPHAPPPPCLLPLSGEEFPALAKVNRTQGQ